MTELDAAAKFFYSKLSSLVSGWVYADAAPGSTEFPCIVFSLSAADDTVAVGNERLLTNPLYLVRAVDRGAGYSGAEIVAAAIDAAIHDVSDGNVLCSGREKPFQRSYEIDGVTYYERGGYYRLRIHGG